MSTSIKFNITAERMNEVTLGELLAIEENPNNIKGIMQFMTHFVVDDTGKWLEEEEAKKAVLSITIGQLKSAFEKVTTQMGDIAVPNE